MGYLTFQILNTIATSIFEVFQYVVHMKMWNPNDIENIIPGFQ